MPFESHPELITPPDDTVLWRYMDFARFVHLIDSQTLRFPRTDQFEDPLEGTYTDAELGRVHTTLNASTIRAKLRKARKTTSSFSNREKMRRKPLSRLKSRSKIRAGPILALRVAMLSPRRWAPSTANFSENRPSDWIGP